MPITVVPAAAKSAQAGGEILRLQRAAGGVVLGVEVQHHLAGAQRRQGDGAAAIAGQGEIGGGLSGREIMGGSLPCRDM